MSGPMERLRFLLGEWKGWSEDQFGEEGIIESKMTFTLEPSDRFIAARGRILKGGPAGKQGG